ncbi:MAG: type VI secretion system tip protein TssI/VgrG [Pelistega sp.]|nr:type VI secretion system tip protein TssI/VgrG [Pelistega sp.]
MIDEDNTQFLFDELHGIDALSTLSDYTVRLLCASKQDDIEKFLGRSLTVSIDTQAEPRYLNGLIAHFSYLGQEGETDRYYVYQATVVPWFWLTSLTQEFRIYQHKTIIEIIEQILSAYPYDYEWRLGHQYPSYEYCVQYGETDFQFVTRLLEKEGIHYFFRHENNKHTLVLMDIQVHHSRVFGYESIPYYEQDKLINAHHDYMCDISHHQELRSASYELNDYDYMQSLAARDIVYSAQTPSKPHNGHKYEWPGNYHTDKVGGRYASLRLKEQHNHQQYLTLHSTARVIRRTEQTCMVS